MKPEAYFQIASVVLLFATISVAAVTDLLQRKIYNWLTLPAIAFGLTLAYAAGGWGHLDPLHPGAGFGLVDHVAGLVVGFGVFFVVWWGGNGVGAGDVKLMGAIGAIMGFHFLIGAMFWGSLVGLVFGVWALVAKRRLGEGLKRGLQRLLPLGAPTAEDQTLPRIPYGTALSFGTLLAWFLIELPRA